MNARTEALILELTNGKIVQPEYTCHQCQDKGAVPALYITLYATDPWEVKHVTATCGRCKKPEKDMVIEETYDKV